MALLTCAGQPNNSLRALTGKAYILAKWKRRLIAVQDHVGSNPTYEQTAFSTCAE